MSFNTNNTNSCIYRIPEERSNFLSYTYFKEIRASVQNPNTNCADLQQNTNYETPNSTYLQAATFKNINEDNTKYFMIINRRCSPGDDDCSGRRFVTVIFDSTNVNDFNGFNNWKIIDLYNDSLICIFDKRLSTPISLGKYKPGEGKLYKLTPVMVDGGTLFVDENLGNISFSCIGNVNNGGHNITLDAPMRISFNGNGKIVMGGGNFISRNITNNQSYKVILQGYNEQWEGLSFAGCNNVEISSTDFSDICYILNDTIPHNNSAIDIINCFNFTISGNSFNQNTPAHAINILIDDASSEWSNAYIGYNNFQFSQNSQSSINVYSLAGGVTPVYICNNNLNCGEQQISNAIWVDGITGGTIRNNTIINFIDAITILNSTIDLFNNYIYSNTGNSIGISGYSSSNINMTPNLGYYTGGSNNIITANNSCKNINVDNSLFNIQTGNNIFNISSSSSSYNLYGTFPGESESVQYAQKNCFQIDTINTQPTYQVLWESSQVPVSFEFSPFSCEIQQFQDYDVFTFSNANNDTIYKIGSGSGGGMRGFDNEQNNTENIYSKLCDSLNINVRKRNYPVIEIQSKYLLSNYPDSLKTLAAINWLYYAMISRDSITNRMNFLKTYYETLMLNNPNNEALTERSFYFIQKCKVALKQYQDAMTGFQLIMTQHPYSYEGLVASWDYAATHLLDSVGGNGGGIKNVERSEIPMSQRIGKQLSMYNLQLEDGNNVENSEDFIFPLKLFTDNYDSTKFSKSDRVKLFDNTKKSFEVKKKKDIEKMNDLTKRVEKGDKNAKKELEVKKAIKEAVKIKTPKTHIELKGIISNDVNKIFAKKINKSEEVTKQIPKEFALYQNYPNPFNPVTKISFDLPKDSKVKLIVYDILGREITRLLNSEFRPAGKHIIEFNAVNLNLASGVYFYKIETDKFISVKKMLLIK